MLMWWYALWAYESFRWDLLAKRSALYDYRKAAFIHQVFLFIFYYKWSWKTAQLHFNLKTSPKCFVLFFLVILFFHCFFSFLLTQCHFFSIVIVYFTPFSKYYKSAWAVFPSKGYFCSRHKLSKNPRFLESLWSDNRNNMILWKRSVRVIFLLYLFT